MKLGIASSLHHESPLQWAVQLKNLGCKSVVFPLNCNDSKDRINAYAEAAKEQGLTIAEVGIWNNMLDPDKEKRKQNIDYNIRQLILADEIGAVCAVNIAGTPHGPRWDGGYRENFSAETFDMTVETIRYILSQAKVKNTFFSIESMPWMIPSGPKEYLNLIERVNHPRFAAHLDLVNMITTPKRYFFNDEFIKECFETLKGHICSCHLKDILLKEEFTFQLRECAVGEGALDIALYLDTADKENPNMPMILEHLSSDEEYIKSIDYINGLYKSTLA
ncbi:MAG: sugar phosphate isomerase/epimerase [Ruminiclostridium sp.]|nr:sugar phosphate isomerase/epimerase [Ruminiclostridium sp.]